MALTWTFDSQGGNQLIGTQRVRKGTVTFDSSYATGGETFTPADLGLAFLTDLQVEVDATAGYVPVWNRSTTAPKLMAFYGDNNNAADGPLIEVPNATNIATAAARFTAYGY